MKKRTLAILLTIALVLSAVAVLVACSSKEVTVTFREPNSKKLEEVVTVNGKAVPSEKTTIKAGYTLEGWYKTVGQDENGNYTFKDKVDLSKEVFTEDTDLYANWTRNLSKGEDEGYCVIGVIGGVQDWDPASRAEDEDSQLTYVGNPVNLYSITMDVKGLDSFKVKTSYKDWDTKEINYGGDKVTKVTKADSVTLPEGAESPSDLFVLAAGGNIDVRCNMNITVNFYYNGKINSYIEIVVNSVSGEIVKPVGEVGMIVVGTITGWKESIAADDTANAKYIMTTTDKNVFTLTGLVLPADAQIKFKVNEDGWREEIGFGKVASVTFDESVTALPEGITSENAKDIFSGDSENAKGNITAKYAMTVNVKLTLDSKKIEIVVTAIDTVKPVPDNERGIIVVGSINGWNGMDDTYLLTPDAEKNIFTINGLNFVAGSEFKMKVLKDGWDPQWGYHGENMTVTLAQGVEGTAADYIGDSNGNIKVLKNCTLDIELNYETGKYTITVNAIGADKEAMTAKAVYATLAEAVAAAQNNDTIYLLKDVVIDAQIKVTKKITLNLNGKTITNTADIWNNDTAAYSLIALTKDGEVPAELTITGNGKVIAKENDCYAVAVYWGAKLVIENGEFVGNMHAIYVHTGSAEIKGGKFDLKQLDEDKIAAGGTGHEFTLNLLDANGKNGTATIVVTGGQFVEYDPSLSTSEDPEANFVAEGYEVTSEVVEDKTIYTVSKSESPSEIV